MKITVKCGVCNKILATVEGNELPQDTVSMYQQGSACDQDEQADIQVSVEGE